MQTQIEMQLTALDSTALYMDTGQYKNIRRQIACISMLMSATSYAISALSVH